MEDVIKKFSEDALVDEMNERVPAGLKEWETYVVERHFPQSGSVLNVGCGCGREALALSKMGYDVYATDIAEPQLVVAENNARDAGLAVSFAMSDGVSSPFGDKQFDVIVIWTQVLGNIPSQEDRLHLLASCRQVMKPAGMLTASVHDGDFCARKWPADVDDGWLYPWGKGHLRYKLFSKAELDALLSTSGLRVVETSIRSSLEAVIFAVATGDNRR